MNRRVNLAILGATAGALAGALSLMGRMDERRNVQALARHVGCSMETARDLYRLARREGYGAAYVHTFPGQGIPGVRPF